MVCAWAAHHGPYCAELLGTMMATKLKEYQVSRRMAVWVEATIRAENFADAVEKAKTMPDSDFFSVPDGVEFIGSERLPGHGVRETW